MRIRESTLVPAFGSNFGWFLVPFLGQDVRNANNQGLAPSPKSGTKNGSEIRLVLASAEQTNSMFTLRFCSLLLAGKTCSLNQAQRY